MRRAAVLCAVLVLACAGLSGCAGLGFAGSVRVIGPWTGSEEDEFRKALASFTAETGISVDYQGTRALGEALSAGQQNRTLPDVAVLPSVGDLPSYRRDLVPLEGIVGPTWTAEYSAQWQDLARTDGRMFAVPIHASLKSTVWSRAGVPQPGTGPQLAELTRSMRASGHTPWCAGVGAAATSGWPGTDWVEDLLLRQSGPEVYRRWVAGEQPWGSPEVRRAWQTWAAVATDPAQVRGGPTAEVLTDFDESSVPMFGAAPECSLEHQGSFMVGVYGGRGLRPGEDFDFFRFAGFEPEHADSRGTWEVSADVAGMFRDTRQARELLRFLVSRQAQTIWSAGPTFSANKQVPPGADASGIRPRITRVLSGIDARLCMDASDLMPAQMREAFQRAVLEQLSDPDRLDRLLSSLDTIRRGIPDDQWSSRACGR